MAELEFYDGTHSGQQIDDLLNKSLSTVGKGINLLDNWYFVGGGSQQGGGQFPINQRGLTSYSGAGYGIDRWYSGDPSASVTINQGSVTFAVASQYNGILQYIEEPMLIDGQTYTLSILTTSGCYSWTFVASKTTPAQSPNGWFGVADLYSYVNFFSNSKWRIFLFDNAISSVKTVDVIAVKLELGDKQTLARQVNGNWVLNDPPPNFQQELAKCQLYQWKPTLFGGYLSTSVVVGTAVDASSMSVSNCLFPVTMRATPNLGTISLRDSGTGAEFTISSYSASPTRDGVVYIYSIANSPLTAGHSYTLSFVANANL